MRILVTGGDGQLGLSIRKAGGEFPQHTFTFTDLPQADITDRSAMERAIRESGAEVIINCAAYTAVDKAEDEPAAALAVNRDGPRTLAGLAAERGLALIHISTDYVFDGTAVRPITENDAPNPANVYGRTKLEGETAVRQAGCDAAVVRTSWLYSEFGHNFVKTMIRKGREGASLRVVDDQTGCPTYAADLARAVIRLAERGAEGFEVYNFCGGGQTTWYGFAREIFRLAGIEADMEPVATGQYPTPAARPAYSVLDTSKIRRAGIEVPGWKESLAQCVAIIEKERYGN